MKQLRSIYCFFIALICCDFANMPLCKAEQGILRGSDEIDEVLRDRAVMSGMPFSVTMYLADQSSRSSLRADLSDPASLKPNVYKSLLWLRAMSAMTHDIESQVCLKSQPKHIHLKSTVNAIFLSMCTVDTFETQRNIANLERLTQVFIPEGLSKIHFDNLVKRLIEIARVEKLTLSKILTLVLFDPQFMMR